RREDETQVVPHVLGCELQALRQQIAELAEFADRIGEPETKTIDVRAALRRRDQMDVAFLALRSTVAAPGDRPLRRFLLAFGAAAEQLRGQPFAFAERLAQVLVEPARVEPLFFLASLLDRERDAQTRAQHGPCTPDVLQPRHRAVHGLEELRVRPAAHRRARLALAAGAGDLPPGAASAGPAADVVLP